MKKLDLNIYATFIPSKYPIKFLKKEKKEFTNLIASIFLTNIKDKFDYDHLANELLHLNTWYFNIINIYPLKINTNTTNFLFSNFNSNLPISKKNVCYSVKYFSFTEFIQKNLINLFIDDFFKCQKHNKAIYNDEFIDKKNNNFKFSILKNTIFIFHGLPLPLIIAAFKYNNCLVNGGYYARRIKLSYNELLLSVFVAITQGLNNINIFHSQHGFDPLFSQSFFDFTKPDFNFSTSVIFFALLERYCKIKNNIEIHNDTWDWSPNKNLYTESFINLNEFNEFCNHYKKDDYLIKLIERHQNDQKDQINKNDQKDQKDKKDQINIKNQVD